MPGETLLSTSARNGTDNVPGGEGRGTHADRGGESGKLPGLVNLFRAQLWLGILGGVLGAGGLFYMVMAGRVYSADAPWLMGMALVLLVFCALYFWVLSAISARSPDAPRRCRFLAGLSIGLSCLAMALCVFLWFFDYISVIF